MVAAEKVAAEKVAAEKVAAEKVAAVFFDKFIKLLDELGNPNYVSVKIFNERFKLRNNIILNKLSSREVAANLLKNAPIGSWLIRPSSSVKEDGNNIPFVVVRKNYDEILYTHHRDTGIVTSNGKNINESFYEFLLDNLDLSKFVESEDL